MSAFRSALFAFTLAAAVTGCREKQKKHQEPGAPNVEEKSPKQGNADPGAIEDGGGVDPVGTPGAGEVADVPDDAMPSDDAQMPEPDRSSRRSLQPQRSGLASEKQSMAQADQQGMGSDMTPGQTPGSDLNPPIGSDVSPQPSTPPPGTPATPPVGSESTPTPAPTTPTTPAPGTTPGTTPMTPPTTPQPGTQPGTTPTTPSPSTPSPGTPATPPVGPQPSPQSPPTGTTPAPFTPGPG